MRLLVVYRHYWPDATPYARILRLVLKSLVSAGHNVQVFTAQPTYNSIIRHCAAKHERLDGVAILRFAALQSAGKHGLGQKLNILWFLCASLHRILVRRNNFDFILASANPPVLMAFFLLFLRKVLGIKYILNYQDVHPEGAIIAGDVKSRLLASIMLRVDTAACRNSSGIVTLSDDMKNTLLERDASLKVSIINNFSPHDEMEFTTAASNLPADLFASDKVEYRVLFAGNMGRYQQLERVIAAAKELSVVTNVKFIFMGAGDQYQALKEMAADLLDESVFFVPAQTAGVAFKCMRLADLGIISLAPGISRIGYPSKTFAYWEAGCPVLGVVDASSSIARDILTNDLGVVPNSLGAAGIASAILAARDRYGIAEPARNELITRRARAKFGQSVVVRQWLEFISTIEGVGTGMNDAAL